MIQFYPRFAKLLCIVLLSVCTASAWADPADSSLYRNSGDSLRTEAAAPQDGFYEQLKSTTANGLQRAQEALSAYQPGGKVNPVSQELVQVVFYFMATFVTCILLMLVLILVSRVARYREAKKYARIKERYENKLVELLYSEETEIVEEVATKPAPAVEEGRQGTTAVLLEEPVTVQKVVTARPRLSAYFDAYELKNAFNRQVLTALILELHKNLSGSTAGILRELYLELKLEREAIRQLKRYDWSVRAKAVRELAQMEIREAEPAITALLNHSNPILALEVQIALLKLNQQQPFAFLDKTEIEITEWQQVSLLTIISHSPEFKVPDFSQWLISTNDSVLIFVTKMIGYYNQLEAAGKLIAQLPHANPKVRYETIRCLGELELPEADQPLMERYPHEPEELQNEILLALGKIGTERALVFLGSILRSPEFVPSFYAAKGLVKAGPAGVKILQEAAKEREDLQKIVNHVMDERI